jgi:DNA-binding NarL/FixJ family response regulator
MLFKLKGLDVVVADDSEQMRAYHRSVLELLEASRIREVEEGAEAFREICADTPDLLITDYGMAPEDGVELTRKVRNKDVSPNPYLPVIMVTAYTDKARISLARDAGVSGLLHKPVSPQELSHTIADVIGDPRPFIRTRDYFGPDRRSGRGIVVRNERRAPSAAAGP